METKKDAGETAAEDGKEVVSAEVIQAITHQVREAFAAKMEKTDRTFGGGEGLKKYTYIVDLTPQMESALQLPAEINLPEGHFKRKKEFHATALGFGTADLLREKVKQAQLKRIDLNKAISTFLSDTDFSFEIIPNTLTLNKNNEYDAESVRTQTGRHAFSSEYSITVDIEMPGMQEYFNKMRTIGIELGKPNTHITLYVKDNGDATGLGISLANVETKEASESIERTTITSDYLGNINSPQQVQPCNIKNLTPKIQQTIKRAAEFHQGQTRKASETPYIVHPYGVAQLVEEMGGDEDQICAALLHDVLEDVPGTSYQALVEEFGSTVANYVKELSEDKDPALRSEENPSWQHRKNAYLAHTQKESEGALTIAIADKLYNLNNFLEDYKEKGPDMLKNFNASLIETLWFYRSFIEIAEERMPQLPLVKKLRQIYAELEKETLNIENS